MKSKKKFKNIYLEKNDNKKIQIYRIYRMQQKQFLEGSS